MQALEKKLKVTAPTNAAVTFEILGSDQLGTEPTYREGMLMGTIDMAILISNCFSGIDESTGFF